MQHQRSSPTQARRGRAWQTAFLSALGIVLLATSTVATARTVENEGSAFEIFVDGRFSGGVAPGGIPNREWSDVTPLALITSAEDPALQTDFGRPEVNMLFATVATVPGESLSHLHAYLVALPRTVPTYAAGDLVAEFAFPYTIDGMEHPTCVIRVHFLVRLGTFSFSYDVDGDGESDGLAGDIGIEGAVDFGPSPLSSEDHLMVEVKIPIRQTPKDGGAGINDTGVPNTDDFELGYVARDDEGFPRGGQGSISYQGPGVVVFSDTPELEICDDGLDNDGNGLTDCADASCEEVASALGCVVPGDCNGDEAVDVSDGSCVFGVLFLGNKDFPCGDGTPGDPANVDLVDWQPDGQIDLSDGVGLLQFLFSAGAPHPLAVPEFETSARVVIPGCAGGV